MAASPSTVPKCSYFDHPVFRFRPLPPGAPQTCPVVIVGAGPIGLVAALELGRRGVPCIVLEAADTVSAGSRAVCISRRSMEILQKNGALERFMREALPWTQGTSYYRDRPIYRLSMPHSNDERFAPMANLQQNLFEDMLVECVAAHPSIDLRWQSRMVGLIQQADQVKLTIETPAGPYNLSAAYVIAADGARSEARNLLGLHLRGESHTGRYLIADIRMRSTYPTERRVWFDPPSNPANTVLMHKQPRDVWRVDYQLAENADEQFELSDTRVRARIQTHLDFIGETAPWELEWVSLYKAHCLCLDDYRVGRVFFAGDAAHLVPIFGVRGLNSGVADASNIAWKLAAVLRGAGSAALLDSFSLERRAATLDVFDNARKSTQFMTPPTRGHRLLRDAVLQLCVTQEFARPLVNPRQSTPYDYIASPLTSPDVDAALFAGGLRPGAALTNVRLSVADAARCSIESSGVTEPVAPYQSNTFLLDHLGVEFTLLVFGADDRFGQDLLAWLPPAHCAVVHILHLGAGGAAAQRYAAQKETAYLVRPDGHICARWKRASANQLRDAMARALGAS